MKTCRFDNQEILTIFLLKDGRYEIRISSRKGSESVILTKEDIIHELEHPQVDAEILGN